mmetsp:Transcript_103576/g.189598  ORF Transcript_103576/g.189598 Transcript_103576/m.189598 type:complete len:628 (+) Transcript_103576:129-2012(+)
MGSTLSSCTIRHGKDDSVSFGVSTDENVSRRPVQSTDSSAGLREYRVLCADAFGSPGDLYMFLQQHGQSVSHIQAARLLDDIVDRRCQLQVWPREGVVRCVHRARITVRSWERPGELLVLKKKIISETGEEIMINRSFSQDFDPTRTTAIDSSMEVLTMHLLFSNVRVVDGPEITSSRPLEEPPRLSHSYNIPSKYYLHSIDVVMAGLPDMPFYTCQLSSCFVVGVRHQWEWQLARRKLRRISPGMPQAPAPSILAGIQRPSIEGSTMHKAIRISGSQLAGTTTASWLESVNKCGESSGSLVSSISEDDISTASEEEADKHGAASRVSKCRSLGSTTMTDWFTVGPLLGHGSFGRVFKSQVKDETSAIPFHNGLRNGQLFVVKAIPIPTDTWDSHASTRLARLKAEVSTLAALQHKHVVQYFGCEVRHGQLCIYLQLYPGGSIGNQLAEFGHCFNPGRVARLTKQILSALVYVHGQGILHGDIKPDNLFLRKDDELKLGDFGMSRRLDGRRPSGPIGSPVYMAPEAACGDVLTDRCDVWSVGAVVFILSCGKRLWLDCDCTEAIFYQLSRRVRPNISLMPDVQPLTQLVHDCLDPLPEMRPSAAELLQYPMIEGAGVDDSRPRSATV